MIKVSVAGVGAWGPGFENWDSLRGLLQGQPHQPLNPQQPPPTPSPQCIPPRERRRAPLSVKLAVEVAEQACTMAGVEAGDAACVFASGMGDMQITDYMCRTLVSEQPQVSPTKFHNSVHNAAVGYWSISKACRQPSNAVSAFSTTVPASLLEAMVQCETDAMPVLWACQDIVAPEPFHDIANIHLACAFSLLLLPAGHEPVSASLVSGSGQWPQLESVPFGALYATNPTARLIPVLQAMSRNRPWRVSLPLNATLDLQLEAP